LINKTLYITIDSQKSGSYKYYFKNQVGYQLNKFTISNHVEEESEEQNLLHLYCSSNVSLLAQYFSLNRQNKKVKKRN